MLLLLLRAERLELASRLFTARRILAAALILHGLIFLRTAVSYAPEFYLSGKGADRVFYFAYVRSILFDADLDFRNEIAIRPPTSGLRYVDGRPLNKYPIGAPLLAMPAVAVAHVATRVAQRAGWVTSPPDGFERWYTVSYAIGQLAWVSIAVILMYHVTREFSSDNRVAALTTSTALFSTSLLEFTAADLVMAQAASFFAITWVLYGSLQVSRSPARPIAWFALGVAISLMVMVRLQNVLYMVVPLAGLVAGLRWHRDLASAAPRLLALFLGAVLGFLPQLLVWRILHGGWVVNPYSSETSFVWSAPHLIDGLVRLAPWWPVLTVAVAGCLYLSILRRHWLPALSVAATLASMYVVVSWWAWDIIVRTAFDNLAAVSMGLAVWCTWLQRDCVTLSQRSCP